MSYGEVDHDHLALVVTLWVLPTVGVIAERWHSVERSARAGWALHVMQWLSFTAELTSVVVLWFRGRALLTAAVFWMGFHAFTMALLYIHFAPTAICWLAFAPLERLVPGSAGSKPGGGSAQAGDPPGIRCRFLAIRR